jgi:hypothetical protein
MPSTKFILIFFCLLLTKTGSSVPLNYLSITASVPAYFNTIETGRPDGRPYILADCNATASGSISFTSTGVFTSNTYTAQLSSRYTNYATANFGNPITLGTLVSDANSGTINITIPAGTNGGEYEIRIISSSPAVIGSNSGSFIINGGYCQSENSDGFRSRVSGDWNDLNTWESSRTGATWIPATRIPDNLASWIDIRAGYTVTITTSVDLSATTVSGTLKLLNGNGNTGHITVRGHSSVSYYSMIIWPGGVFQVVSSSAIYAEAITYSGNGNIIVDGGKITIGDGSSTNAEGYSGFAVGPSQVIFNNGVFEWNSSSTIGPVNDDIYFVYSTGHPTFRLTTMPPGSFGSDWAFIIYGYLEVNTPVTFAGSAAKQFRDGIKGTSVITQAPGCGGLEILAPDAILDGTITINLSTGLYIFNGITLPGTAHVTISGPCTSTGQFKLQTGAHLTLENGTILTISN